MNQQLTLNRVGCFADGEVKEKEEPLSILFGLT